MLEASAPLMELLNNQFFRLIIKGLMARSERLLSLSGLPIINVLRETIPELNRLKQGFSEWGLW
ncbi:hypothetical protein TUM19329_27340 [Legionella antarctica]|uniref:Uncharacterized protein n=1 Tax=Legionella antarctica TaxID=2708020 RepID=A0A6F8T842_9GAMM|nr:hypothetical protein [Legionella antarctica]BCA96373.1 hypothetical protein TUM19329_27340 [Legionella antarctica]